MKRIHTPRPIAQDTEEEDLWFLPGPVDDGETASFAPQPRRLLIDPADWHRAEADCAVILARAAAALAVLDQRCVDLGSGASERLALIEVETMLWAQGARIRREHIVTSLSGAGGPTDGRPELAQAAWAYRRMLARPGPLPAMRGFLGLHEVPGSDLPEALSPRPKGAEFDLAADQFTEGMGAMANCHPLTQAAYGLALWRLTGLSAPEDLVEPATAAARIAAQDHRALGFAPLSPGRGVWQLGAQSRRLGDWLVAIRSGALAAAMELNRVAIWAEASKQATKHIKGSSSEKLINALAARPILTTEAATTLTNMSRDSTERGLTKLHAMGIIREITGSKRFRLWTCG